LLIVIPVAIPYSLPVVCSFVPWYFPFIITLNYMLRLFFVSPLVVFTIGSTFQCGAQSISHIFIGRAVGGVGVGALRYDNVLQFIFFSLSTLWQHAFPAIHGRNQSTRGPWVAHRTRAILDSIRRGDWVLDGICYTFKLHFLFFLIFVRLPFTLQNSFIVGILAHTIRRSTPARCYPRVWMLLPATVAPAPGTS
jgi:hypothetical protein